MLELVKKLIADAKQKTLTSSSLENQVYDQLGIDMTSKIERGSYHIDPWRKS
ncbi:MAG: hypothetical protein QMC95_15220 [Desulfitobacteriaceae bacterium]|nr:hypothetical protein [Desulfitobacteriaceae bacterium]MDI6915542.1 hypothetical protein [Desulfitobacteriaceae bacterium]